MNITHKFVKERFSYDEEGFLVWTEKANNQHSGRRAGYLKKDGYLYIDFFNNKKTVPAHRVIFLWHNGYVPERPLTVDHINRNRLDNRIENLRVATPTQQNANKPVSPLSVSKVKGVAYDSARNKYRAIVSKNGVRRRSKRFDTVEEAKAAYAEMAKECFGEFYSEK